MVKEAAVDGAETGAVEKAGIDQIPEEQPQTEVTPEELVAEVNKPEDESGGVGGVEQEETAHEAEPIAAEANIVVNDNHEAVKQDEPVATEEANGNEATLERLDEQPKVTEQVETTPCVEEPQVDGVVDDAAVGQVEELAGEGVTVHAEAQAVAESAAEETPVGEDIPADVVEEVQAPVVNDEAPTTEAGPVEVTAGEVPLSVEAVAIGGSTSEVAPASVELAEAAIDEAPEATKIAREEESAPAEPVVVGEVDEEVTAAVEAEGASEGALAPVAVEAIAGDAPVPTESQVAVGETSVPDEVTSEEPPVAAADEDEAVARVVALETEPTAEVTASEETVAPVKPEPAVDVATNEESSAPAVEAEPVVNEEITGAVQAESVIDAAVEGEPTTDVTSEEAPAPVKAELVASETAPIETEPAAEITEMAAPIVAEGFSEITSQDISAPVDAELIPAPAEAELIPDAVNEETSTAIESEANVSEETPGPAPVEAEPVAQPTDEAIGATAPAGTEVTDEDASESKPATDITGEIESSGPAGAELVTTAAIHEDVPNEDEAPLGEVRSEVVPEEVQESEIASDKVPVEANPEPVTEISASEAAPVEVQEGPCDDSTDDAPVGVAQKEIVVEGTPATVDPIEPSTEDALGHVADTEPENVVEPALDEQEESEAGIKDDTEVALEGASIALATNAVGETLSAVSSESVKEANVEVVHDEQPTLAQNGHLSDVLEPPITVDEEQQTEPVEDDVPHAEPLVGLKTENLYVQTALDTTLFTPIVDSGIEVCLNIFADTYQSNET